MNPRGVVDLALISKSSRFLVPIIHFIFHCHFRRFTLGSYQFVPFRLNRSPPLGRSDVCLSASPGRNVARPRFGRARFKKLQLGLWCEVTLSVFASAIGVLSWTRAQRLLWHNPDEIENWNPWGYDIPRVLTA